MIPSAADVILAVSALCMLGALVAYVHYLRARTEKAPAAARYLHLTGFGLLLLDFVLISISKGSVAMHSMRDSLLFFAIVLMCVTYAAGKLAASPIVLVLMLPMVLGLEIVSLFFERWFTTLESREFVSNTFLVFHILLFLLSYAFFFLAAACGLWFLVLDRILKSSKFPPIFFKMPGLKKLDNFAYRFSVLGLFLLSCAMGISFTSFTEIATGPGHEVLSGAMLGRDVTVLMTLVLWIYYNVYLFLRVRFGWVGRKSSYLAVCGLLLVLVFYFVSKVAFSGSLHGYNSGVKLTAVSP